jgi:hypothetical protein
MWTHFVMLLKSDLDVQQTSHRFLGIIRVFFWVKHTHCLEHQNRAILVARVNGSLSGHVDEVFVNKNVKKSF